METAVDLGIATIVGAVIGGLIGFFSAKHFYYMKKIDGYKATQNERYSKIWNELVELEECAEKLWEEASRAYLSYFADQLQHTKKDCEKIIDN